MGFLSLQSIIPPGTVLAFAGGSAPSGWELCDGRAVSRTTYAALFSSIGTFYGSGNGTTTFNLPDYRWTFLRGSGPAISVTGGGSAASNQATFTGHGFNRTGVKVRLSSGTLTGLALDTDYWVIVVDANTLAFAATKTNSISGTRVAISGTNSAVVVQYEDPDAGIRESNTSGANSSDTVGSKQDDAIQRITASIQWTDTSGVTSPWVSQTGAFSLGGPQYARYNRASTTGGSFYSILNFDSALVAKSSSETRPSNVSVNYIIKV